MNPLGFLFLILFFLIFLLGPILGLIALLQIRNQRIRLLALDQKVKSLQQALFDLQQSARDYWKTEEKSKAEIKSPALQTKSQELAWREESVKPAPSNEATLPETTPPLTQKVVEIPAVPPLMSEAIEAPPIKPLPQEPQSMEMSESSNIQSAPLPVVEKMDLETRIGAVWFNRIGLVGLLIGFALLGRMIDFHPWHKVAGSYLVSAALLFVSKCYENRLKRWSRPTAAGGLALAFFTSYASHFIPAMACLPLGVSLALMTASVGGVFLCAERWRSESTAGLAIFLGHVAAYTSGGSADSFSLIAIVFLSMAAFVLFWRHNWAPLSLFAVCAAYLSHVLWALQDHAPSTPEFSFWLNFYFLTSYYLIFLSADLIHRHRVWIESGDFGVKQSKAARLVGPASLIFYASVVSGLFYMTKVYWGVIYLYYLPLAGLQTALLFYHRSRRNPDYSFYAAAASIFLTLGLCSWMSGLSLNMALAAEALILLILSRRLQLWYLNPLAQSVLIANFLHFWFSNAGEFDTWPSYIGCVLTSCVYFVKSRLEETWPAPTEDSTPWESKWAQRLAGWILRSMPVFAYLHALGGAALAIYQTAHFFEPLWEESVIAWLAAGLTLGVILTSSRAWTPAVWIMQIAVLLIVMNRRSLDIALPGWFSNSNFWGSVLDQAISIPSVAGACAAFYFARRRRQALFAILALGSLIAIIPVVSSLVRPIDPQNAYIPVWLISPLAFWAFAVYYERFNCVQDWRWSGGDWEQLERKAIHSSPSLAAILAAMGAFLTYLACRAALPSLEYSFIVLSVLGLAIAFIAAYWGIAVLALGLIVHWAILLNRHCHDLIWAWISGSIWQTWLIPVGAILTSGLFFIPLVYKRRASFGAGALTVIFMVLSYMTVLAVQHLSVFPFYPIWLAILTAIWAQVEWLNSLFGKNHGDESEWRDSFCSEFINKNMAVLGHISSVVAAFVLFLITFRNLSSSPLVLWLALLYCVLLGVAAWRWRSSMFASAIPVLLFASHVVYYADIHPGSGASLYPYLTSALCLGTFASAGMAEWLLYNRFNQVSLSLRAYLVSGSFFYYGLAFLLGWIFLKLRGSMLWDHSAFTFALHMALPFLAIGAARLARLGLLDLATILYTVFWLFPGIVNKILERFEYREDLLYGGALVFILAIGMERILSSEKSQTISCMNQIILQRMRKIIIVVSSVLMLFFITETKNIQNYWTTFGWSLLGFFVIILGFLWKDKTYRRTALAIFLLCISRILFNDIAQLEAFYRMVAFLGLGACLIAVSFLYSRFSKEIQKWL